MMQTHRGYEVDTLFLPVPIPPLACLHSVTAQSRINLENVRPIEAGDLVRHKPYISIACCTYQCSAALRNWRT